MERTQAQVDAAVALNERLSNALGGHDVHPEEAYKVQQAYLDAGMDTAGWDDLPPDIQRLVEQIETYPATSWDDPRDVPDNLHEL